jgi:phage terminase large subunit
MSYNPVSCWINDYKGDNIATIHSTIDDNPFVNEAYRKTLDKLKEQNYNLYLIYRLGIEGQLKGLIYNNWKEIDKYPDSYDEIIYGMDFGFNNPTAIIEIGDLDQEFYLTERLYEPGLTDDDIIERLKSFILPEHRSRYIYADCERPESIEQIARAGFNVLPCVKGKGSVLEGINFLKRLKIYTRKENTNLNKEKDGYCYKEDKDGRTLEEPVKFMDHGLDGVRYALYTHYKDRLGMESLLDIIKNYDGGGDMLESAGRIL